MKEILDTRFLITHFFSDQPPLLDRARSKLHELRRTRNGVLPTLVLLEFYDQVCRRAGSAEASRAADVLLVSGLEIQPLTVEISLAAGGIRCRHHDIPMADCVIAATAEVLRGRVVTDDPHFGKVKGLRTTWI